MIHNPEVGEWWIHRNGNRYEIIAIANLPNEERYPKTVVYRGENGNLWARPMSDWHRSFTEESA